MIFTKITQLIWRFKQHQIKEKYKMRILHLIVSILKNHIIKTDILKVIFISIQTFLWIGLASAALMPLDGISNPQRLIRDRRSASPHHHNNNNYHHNKPNYHHHNQQPVKHAVKTGIVVGGAAVAGSLVASAIRG